MSDEFTRWAETLQKEVYEYWKSNHSDWEPGFQVYYDPADPSAEILILGYQPGGGAPSFEGDRERFEQGDFSLPERYHYLTSNYPLANKMENFLGESGIRNSVKTNINFFRASGIDYWKANFPKERREEVEEFCFQRVEGLIEKIDPELIITEGTDSTLDPLNRRFGLKTEYEIRENGGLNRRLVSVSRGQQKTVIGLIHPSGARISNQHLGQMKEEIREIVDRETSVGFTSP